jgi:hypothetical protein
MIVMKFGGTSVQDAQAIDRVAAIVRERLQLEIFLSPKFRPTTRQVSGHEFTRAAQPQNIAGFSPCEKDFQGLKAKSSMPFTARLKSCRDTCPDQGNDLVLFSSAPPTALLRVSVSPWWVPLFRSPDHPITRSPDLEWVLP